MASTSPVAPKVMLFDLLARATRAEYGQNVTVRNSFVTENSLKIFQKSMSVRVLRREEKPTPVGRTIVDISTKEFINHAAEDGRDPTAKDITKTIVSNSPANSNVKSYQFISTQGLVWDVSTDIGLQVLAMGMTSGSFQDSSVIQTFGSSLKSSLGFNFSQKETVCVPPGKRVHVTITTSKVLYQLGYTLEFSVPKAGTVYVIYDEPCFCNLFKCPVSRHIPYSQIVQNLPNYHEDEVFAYFTQEGYLSWIGESCEVNKSEALVQVPS